MKWQPNAALFQRQRYFQPGQHTQRAVIRAAVGHSVQMGADEEGGRVFVAGTAFQPGRKIGRLVQTDPQPTRLGCFTKIASGRPVRRRKGPSIPPAARVVGQ